MELRSIRAKISLFRRHFDIQGQDILACYETASASHYGDNGASYITISISPKRWAELRKEVGESFEIKHPGSNVDCLKFFDNLYVRSEARIPDADVEWAPNIGCYNLTKDKLLSSLQAVQLSSRSTKKQIAHVVKIIAQIERSTYAKDV